MEQLATDHIDLLVESVEGVLRTEREGWKSSTESTKRLQEAMDGLQNKRGAATSERDQKKMAAMQSTNVTFSKPG